MDAFIVRRGAGGGGGTKLPGFTYSGSYEVIDDGDGNWRIKFLDSGTLTLKSSRVVDVFLVGGGGGGSDWKRVNGVSPASGGGSGGFTQTYSAVRVEKGTYTVEIGAGGDVNVSGGRSSAFGCVADGGGDGFSGSGGGSGGGGYGGGKTNLVGGSNGGDGTDGSDGDGGSGQGTTTKEFGEENGTLYAGGGGGSGGAGAVGSEGGAGGGGKGCRYSQGVNGGGGTNGQANTGGGGGMGMAGGSGIVIIRNARGV